MRKEETHLRAKARRPRQSPMRQSPMSSRVSLNWTRRFAPPSRTAFKRGLVTWLGLTTISLVALVTLICGSRKADQRYSNTT